MTVFLAKAEYREVMYSNSKTIAFLFIKTFLLYNNYSSSNSRRAPGVKQGYSSSPKKMIE